MTNRRVLLSGAILVGTLAFACSTPPRENPGSTEQRIDIDPDAEAPDAEAGAPACAHALCATGERLTATCDPCAATLCAQDPYCCDAIWDATCVGEVASICGQTCTVLPGTDAGPSTCAHPVCATGAALASACSQCATQLCAQDPYCCAVSWDATCVGEVTAICNQTCN